MAETDQELISQIRELTQSLDEHREDLRVVRDVIDELRELVDYLTRQFPDPTTWIEHLQRRITSMPVDPTADDYAERVNRVTPHDLPRQAGTVKPEDLGNAASSEPPASEARDPDDSPGQRELFRCGQSRPAGTPAPTRMPAEFDDNARKEEAEPAEDYILLNFSDGDVSVYRVDGTWLACEDSRAEAIAEANMVVTAFANGASWAEKALAVGAGHLQKHFPDEAHKYGIANGTQISCADRAGRGRLVSDVQ